MNNTLSEICSCAWDGDRRTPGIDCPVHPKVDECADPVFLIRQVNELKAMLAKIVNGARSTSAAANCAIVHRQLLGEARQILEEEDNDRIARFMELEAMEESDGN